MKEVIIFFAVVALVFITGYMLGYNTAPKQIIFDPPDIIIEIAPEPDEDIRVKQ